MKMVVTGSSFGIGRALVLRLLEHGHTVWGIARSDQSELVAERAGAFFASRCDVADWPSVATATADIERTWTDVDALVTCAGIQGEISRTLSADPARWSATVRTNLDGTFYPIRAIAPLLAKSPHRGKIVCFSGGGATKPRTRFSAYGVAKTGIVRLVETIAEEEGDHALDINAIAPGAINTRLTEEVLTLGPDVVGEIEYAAAQKQRTTGGNSLENALDLVEWLLSSESDGITGRLISAPWDPWRSLNRHAADLNNSDIYTLRRIVPAERGKKFD